MANGVNENESEFERRKRLREQGVSAGYELADLVGGEVGAQEQALESGRAQIRQRAAQSMAGALGGARGLTSGAGLAATRQTGLESGIAEGALEAQSATNIAAARRNAAEARLGAVQFEREAGSVEDERNQLRAAAESEIQAIIAAHKTALWDDNEGAALDIERAAARQSDPVVKAEMMYRASRIRRFEDI